MLLQEEKHSQNGSVAFLVDITNKENNKLSDNDLKIK